VPSGREQYLQALSSLSELTRSQAERVAALLAKQGEVQSAQVGRVAEDMMRRTQKNREILTRLVQREVRRQLGVLGMATRDEVARLQQRVRALEQEVERSSKPASATRGTRSASARATRAASARATRAASAGTPKARAAGSGAAKPSTRTRTGGASSRSTASSPGTRRARGTGASTPQTSPPEGTPR
jgi:polyhydroxyalkanoate synthesis regulator phasin